MLTTLLPEPGVVREGTQYTAEGRWYDCNNIRWRKGLPEQIGGWSHLLPGSYLGTCRKIHDWGTVDGVLYTGVGTTLKLYVHDGAGYQDITPLSQDPLALGNNPLATSAGSPLVTVTTPSAHDLVPGSYVTLSGAPGTVDGLSGTLFNKEHRVVGTPTSTTFVIVVNGVATTGGNHGGASMVAELQINRGLDYYLPGGGWGAGGWGEGPWGGSTALSAANQLRLWSIDNFGDDMVSCVRTGGVYYWDESAGVGQRAMRIPDLPRRTVVLDPDPIAYTDSSTSLTITDFANHGLSVGDEVTISGATTVGGIPTGEINTTHTVATVPTQTTFTVVVTTAATGSGSGGGSAVQVEYFAGEFAGPVAGMQVMVSPTARHVVVFGANPRGDVTPDPLLVRWSSSENPADWLPVDENSAGGQRISAGSTFIGALRTRTEILIWTDAGLTSMRYVGLPAVFAFTEIESGLSMISPNAAVNAGGVVWFMDRGGFFAYDGSVRRVPCQVRDYVFGDLDLNNAFKIHAGANIDYSEVVWFYPSASGDGTIDRYVKFNYDENLWDFGELSRTAWDNAFTQDNPLAATDRKADLAPNPITTFSASSTITVSLPGHRLQVGDEVILSDLSSVGGIDSQVLNTQWAVASVVDANSFTITLPVSASTSDTGGGSTGTIVVPDVLLSHDVGFADEGAVMDSYIESGDVDIEDGHHFWFVTRVIGDFTYRGTTDTAADVRMKLMVRDYPSNTQREAMNQLVTGQTEQNWVRVRARQMAMRIEAVSAQHGWRLGKVRLDVRQDGRR